MTKKYFLYLLVIIASITVDVVAQAPTGTIVTADLSFCEQADGFYHFKFENVTYPISYTYKVINADGESTSTPTGKFSSEIDAGIPFSVKKTTRIELISFKQGGDPTVYTTILDNSLTITIDRTPTPKAGEDVSGLCGFTHALQGIATSSTNVLQWTVTSGGSGSFDDATVATPVFKAGAPGTFNLKLTETSGACQAFDEVTVGLLGSPKAVLSGAKSICSSNGNDKFNAQLTITGTPGFTYVLTDEMGHKEYGNSALTGITQLEVQANYQTNYAITEVKDGNLCLAALSDLTGEAKVSDNKAIISAGNDISVCEKTYDLKGDVKIIAGDPSLVSINWSALPSEVSFGSADKEESTVASQAYGKHIFRLTAVNAGCSTYDEVTVEFVQSPSLALLKSEATICNGETSNMLLSTASVYDNLKLKYLDLTNEVEEDIKTGASNIAFNPSINSSYKLISITDELGCASTLSDVYTVYVLPVPVANAGTKIASCGKSLLLEAVPSLSTSPDYTYVTKWSGDGLFDDISKPNALFTSSKFNENILTWTEEVTANGITCSDFQELKCFFEIDTITAFAGNDTTLYTTAPLKLQARKPYYGNGIWQSANESLYFDDVNSPNSNVSNFLKGESTLTWKIQFSYCPTVSDNVLVYLNKSTNITGFSPNGDGINDVFRIRNAEQVPNNKLVVFDSRGKLVYSKDNFNNKGWDGISLEGKVLTSGTYYYVFSGDDITTISDYLVIKGAK